MPPQTQTDVRVSEKGVIRRKSARLGRKTRRQPRYHVVLWNDNDHTFDYVIQMLQHLFGHPDGTGYQMADEVHHSGRVICLTTTREHAELKRDQIHAYGTDNLVRRCRGSMSSSIEPEIG